MKNVGQNGDPVIVSYYTRDTYYEKEAAYLKASCEKWGLEYHIEGIEAFGKWNEHTCYKPVYILQKLRQLRRPLVWIDADAEVVQKPTLFAQISCDLALRYCDGYPADHPCSLYSGTIYLNYNPSVLAFVEKWAGECQKAKEEGRYTVDQQELIRLLLTEKMRVDRLPAGYVAIFEEEMPEEARYIVHYQASRLYKKIIDGELALGFFDQLSVEELRQIRPISCARKRE